MFPSMFEGETLPGDEPSEDIAPEVWARIAADMERIAFENDELRAEILRLREELRRMRGGLGRQRPARAKRGK
jgi:hypothetical protein